MQSNPTIPNFETPRLLLKPVSITDSKSYHAHFVDYDVIRYLSAAVPWPYPEKGVEYFLEHLVLPRQGIDRWCFGIFFKTNPDELIGCVDLWREPRPENRGFWLGKKFWGQGIMTEAVGPITDYAFNELGFEVLYFSNAVGNTASRRVKEKAGATLLGVRPASFVSAEFTHAELWELKKENYV